MTIDECVFCDIIAGRAEASVAYRDERCIAVMDICPVNAGDVLVIPLNHARDLADGEAAGPDLPCPSAP
jgi:diadenosine tetraphosphate (Ap4A) HIT family hydrolase